MKKLSKGEYDCFLSLVVDVADLHIGIFADRVAHEYSFTDFERPNMVASLPKKLLSRIRKQCLSFCIGRGFVVGFSSSLRTGNLAWAG